MKKMIYIQSNDQQKIGALVAKYSFEKHLTDKSIKVELIETENYNQLMSKSGKLHLRKGAKSRWKNDLQNFTSLRFMPPELMGYEGRTLVVDPDVFALVDVTQLFTMDMQEKSIWARKITTGDTYYWASSVMLLDCEKLRHWNWKNDFEEMFTFKRDYREWMNLDLEDQSAIGELEPKWNDNDHLDEETCLLHTTSRITQPWKTGLPIDFSISEKKRPTDFKSRLLYKLGLKIDPNEPLAGCYKPHFDKNQEVLFYTLLKEAIEAGSITTKEVKVAMKNKNVRPDSLELLKTV